MALIEKEEKIEKSDLRIKIPNPVKGEVDAYCQWAGIDDVGYFFAEAARLVFSKDKDWQKNRG